MTLTPSALGKAELYAKLADKRVAEIVYVANKGKPEQVERGTQRLNSYLARVAVLAAGQKKEAAALLAPAPLAPAPAPAPTRGGREEMAMVDKQAKLRGILSGYAAKHPQALRAVLKTAPASAKSALRRAIAASAAGYEKALEALD